MAGYEVGSVFVQVIPSYRGFIDSIRDQARAVDRIFGEEIGKSKAISKGVEKAFGDVDAKKAGAKVADDYAKGFREGLKGKVGGGASLIPDNSAEATKAGNRAGSNYAGAFERALKGGVAGALRDLPAADVKINDAQAKKDIAVLRKLLENLSGKRIGVDLDANQAIRQLEFIRARLAALRDKNINIDVNTDLDKAQAQLETFLSGLSRSSKNTLPVDVELGDSARRIKPKLDAILKGIAPVKIDADSTEADHVINELRNKARDLDFDVRTGVKGGAEAERELDEIIGKIEFINGHKVDIDVDVKRDIEGTVTNLRNLGNESEKSGGQLRRLSNSLKDNGNSFRIFNFQILAVASLLPTLGPLLTGVTAGFFGLGSAAIVGASGIGVLALAFSGIGDALSAYKAQDQQAATQQATSARAARSAAEGVANAQRTLARAREDAARSAEDSGKRIADAQEAVGRAQESAARSAKQSARSIADAQKGAADAVANLAKVQADAARAAVQSARRVADAERSAAQARVAANRDATAATKAVETAERSYTRAQKDALKAQNDLNDAREDARRNLEDMNNALASGAIQEQQAILGVQEAALSLNAVLEDDQSTARERKSAQLAYDAQVQSLKELQLQNQRLQVDTAKANAAGVDGSDEVVAAREKITDTAQAEQDAQQALVDARDKQAQQAVDSAQKIADADQAVADAREAQAQQAIDSAASIADAQDRIAEANQRVVDAQEAAAQSAQDSARAIVDAQANVADAREAAARSAADSAQSIADAERGVTDALQAQADAAATANAAATNLAYALSRLSPAGQDFVNFLRSDLLPYLDQLRFAAQTGFLPPFTDAIKILLGQYGPGLLKFVGDVAEKLGELSIRAANLLISKPFQDFFATIAQYAPSLLDSLGKLTGGISTILAVLLTAFAPVGDQFLAFLADAATNFGKFLGVFVQSQAFSDFLAYIQQVGPELGDLFVSLIKAALNLLIAMAPVGDAIINALIGVFNYIASLKPEDLRLLVTVILGIVVGIQLMAGAMIILGAALGGIIPIIGGAGATLEALGPVLLVLGAGIAGIAAAFLAFGTGEGVSRFRGFFEFIGGLFENTIELVKRVASAFAEGLSGALGDTSGTLQRLGPDIQKIMDFMGDFGDLVIGVSDLLVEYLGNILGPLFKALGAGLGITLNIIITTVELFIAAVTGDWGAFRDIMLNFGKGLKSGLIDIFTGLANALLGIVGQNTDDVKKQFEILWKGVSGFAKRIYDDVVGFFTDLYDTLVGHSIVPDLVDATLGYFQDLWDNSVAKARGLRDDVVAWFQSLYDAVIGPNSIVVNFAADTFAKFIALRDAGGKAMGELKDNAAKAFTDLKNGVVGKDGIIPTFVDDASAFFGTMRDNIVDAINELPAKFGTAVDNIGTAWDKIRDKTKEPIRFIVNTVLNDGLLAGFNSISKTFTGNDPKLHIDLPKGFSAGGWTGPGSKYKPAGVVHADEFVIRKESQQRLAREQPGLLDHLNTYGRAPGFASGGLVDFGHLIQKKYGALVTENPSFGGVHPVHAKNSLHYSGNAIDVNTQPGTSALEQAQLAPIVALAKANGFNTIFMAPGHYNHAHIEDRSGIKGLIDTIGGAISGAVGSAKNAVDSLIGGLGINLSGFNFSGGFADVVKAVPGLLLSQAKDKLTSLASTVGDLLTPGSDTDVPSGGIGTPGSNKAIVQSIANGYGWGTGPQWDSLVALVNSESGFKNTAQNPTSTAYGMFQFLNSTWGGVGATKTSDPRLQAIAGLKYIANAYKTPVNAWNFHRAHNYYDEGGLVTPPTLYDTGGMIMPGTTQVLNASGKPEALLPAALVDAIMEGGNSRGGPHIETHLDGNFYAFDPRDIAREEARARADRAAVAGLAQIAKGL